MNERFRGNSWKINWNDWNNETFKKAEKENKLILLSLSAIWCHWCHVMDETTYSNEEIIKIINENFIPIRVDVDHRPDISERYNFGGFPTFAFLTPKGEIVSGGTYVPPDHFKEILNEILSILRNKKIEELIPYSEFKRKKIVKSEINGKIVWDILDLTINSFDSQYGGFGTQPKFPITDAIIFLENMYYFTSNNGIKIIIEKTLNGITQGLFDNYEGGFFRYSVTRDWKTPHYEKMLETNSNLFYCYSFAYFLTKNKIYKEISEKTANYLLEKLYNKNEKLFYGSQDADEEYYRKTLKERLKVKPPIIDKNYYSCFNALCAKAFLKSGIIFNNKNYVKIAEEITNKLVNEFLTNNGILHMKNSNISLLNDNVYTLSLLLDLYQFKFDENLIKNAEKIAKIILRNFLDENGLLKDKIKNEEDIGLLKLPFNPINENSIIIKELYVLGEILQRKEYKEIAYNIASLIASDYLKYDIFATNFANALIFLLNPIEIKFVFSDLEIVKKYLNELKINLNYNVYLKYLNINEEEIKKEYTKEGIYICKGNVCYPPLIDKDKILNLLNKLNKEFLQS